MEPDATHPNTYHLRSRILCTEVYRSQNDHLWHPRSEACSRLLAGRMPGEREWESWTVTLLPYDGCVALADGDVVGGPLHIHTPDGESCGDKTQQSEKGSLQLPPTRFASDLHVFVFEAQGRAFSVNYKSKGFKELKKKKKRRGVQLSRLLGKRGMLLSPKQPGWCG